MKPDLLCIPCTVNAAFDIALKATNDPDKIKSILFEVLNWLPKAIEEDTSPNILHSYAFKKVQQLTGVKDPFKDLKKLSNDAALKTYPELWNMIEENDDRIEALRLSLKSSIIGNMIDFEVHGYSFNFEDFLSRIKSYLEEPLAIDDVSNLCRSIGNKTKILYLADNAGEIVFDKLVSRCLKEKWGCEVTMVVKGGPILNDATIEDAKYIGLSDACNRIVTTGDDTIGIVINRASEEFKNELEKADILIAKGQGNFESLIGFEKNIGKPICYVLRAKCKVVAKRLGVPPASNVVKFVQIKPFL
ncbi:MAG: ARMT1-like domain-containing protein [Nitrososphaerota archaeon]|nr:ARMT1-like domain-containing protein [Nitrososphaerota archaeon]